MFTIPGTVKKIEVRLESPATNGVHCVACWRNVVGSGSSPEYVPDSNAVVVSSTSNSDLIPVANGVQSRVVDTMTFFNDSTAQNKVVLVYDVNGSEILICKIPLSPGDFFFYDGGFKTLNANGELKTASVETIVSASFVTYSLPFQRASLASIAGSDVSLWRGTGYPTQAAIPSVAEICSDSTVGAIPLAPRSGDLIRSLAAVAVQGAAVGTTFLFEDRLAQMAGLNGTLTTAQAVNLSLHASLGTSNLAARIGRNDYSEVRWFLEWYTATGATIATPTAQVTYHDGTTGSVNIWVAGATALPASVAASRRYLITPTNGKFIRSIESVTLGGTTGTAGNFGVTAVRQLHLHEVTVANALQYRELLVRPVIANNACLTISQTAITTTSGVSNGTIVQAIGNENSISTPLPL